MEQHLFRNAHINWITHHVACYACEPFIVDCTCDVSHVIFTAANRIQKAESLATHSCSF